MSSYISNTATLYIFFSLCSWRSLARDDKHSKVLLTNNGPTTIGGKTVISAVVVNCPGTNYRYCWQTIKGRDCNTYKKHETSLVIGDWTSTGRWKYTVTVERLTPGYKFCGKNKTDVVVTGVYQQESFYGPH